MSSGQQRFARRGSTIPSHDSNCFSMWGNAKWATSFCTLFPHFCRWCSLAMKVRQTTARRIDLSGDLYSKQVSLSLYKTPPSDDVSMEEFEQFAIDRLKGNLAKFSCKQLNPPSFKLFGNYLRPERSPRWEVSERCPHKISSFGFRSTNCRTNQKRYNSLFFFCLSNSLDIISHFTLRLVYCRPDDRKFFLDGEVRLLKVRLQLVCD